MPLHMTKIAFGAKSHADLESWFRNRRDMRLTTRYLPKRHKEMVGGSLYWIREHALVGRSPIKRFTQRDDGRWFIELEPVLIPVYPQPKRAHQGWRYLAEENTPRDLEEGEDIGDVLPGRLMGKLQKLGLV
ncbi:hypothetical protein HME9302_00774 [Alteripontixanthobacter maritimus]|uniref:DUF1489 family protein n=1 Tax=Alteripontixanthobacter maritimus TaxID=2161824 RepID=A0A369Q4D1_9SPHN|nr:DUF1489 family protein [Alteripontixanthobacter maritimus]RDC59584.1 hypothetical protein HME9302_00774 [Alteripontixanthobacter maritimus]